jgi:hypothetical protein
MIRNEDILRPTFYKKKDLNGDFYLEMATNDGTTLSQNIDAITISLEAQLKTANKGHDIGRELDNRNREEWEITDDTQENLGLYGNVIGIFEA